MSVNMYFINDTKKQVVDCKKRYGCFDNEKELLAYLNLCSGDTLRLQTGDSG